jgi:hypothetical protein
MIIGFERGKGNKKYNAIIVENGIIKKVPFGDKRYAHYRDDVPLNLYSHLNHLDKKRRLNYYKRHNIDYTK